MFSNKSIHIVFAKLKYKTNKHPTFFLFQRLAADKNVTGGQFSVVTETQIIFISLLADL